MPKPQKVLPSKKELKRDLEAEKEKWREVRESSEQCPIQGIAGRVLLESRLVLD
jgi:hypothetical protein